VRHRARFSLRSFLLAAIILPPLLALAMRNLPTSWTTVESVVLAAIFFFIATMLLAWAISDYVGTGYVRHWRIAKQDRDVRATRNFAIAVAQGERRK
jgi:hypothetical protein